MVLRPVLYSIVRLICYSFFRLHNGFRVVGRELLPTQRPLIIAANHVSNLDPIAVGLAFPDRLRPLAKEQLFEINGLFRWLITTLGAIPVKRTSGIASGAALKAFLELLQQGDNLMIFPEGARSADGTLQPIEAGVTLLATKVAVPIVPVYVRGTYEAMPMGSPRIGRHRITVYYGNPIMPQHHQDKPLKEARQWIRTKLQSELERLQHIASQDIG